MCFVETIDNEYFFFAATGNRIEKITEYYPG